MLPLVTRAPGVRGSAARARLAARSDRGVRGDARRRAARRANRASWPKPSAARSSRSSSAATASTRDAPADPRAGVRRGARAHVGAPRAASRRIRRRALAPARRGRSEFVADAALRAARARRHRPRCVRCWPISSTRVGPRVDVYAFGEIPPSVISSRPGSRAPAQTRAAAGDDQRAIDVGESVIARDRLCQSESASLTLTLTHLAALVQTRWWCLSSAASYLAAPPAWREHLHEADAAQDVERAVDRSEADARAAPRARARGSSRRSGADRLRAHAKSPRAAWSAGSATAGVLHRRPWYPARALRGPSDRRFDARSRTCYDSGVLPFPEAAVCGISSRGRFKRSCCWPSWGCASGRSSRSSRRFTSASISKAAPACCSSSTRPKRSRRSRRDVQNQVETVMQNRVNGLGRLRTGDLEGRDQPAVGRAAGGQERRRGGAAAQSRPPSSSSRSSRRPVSAARQFR